MQLKTPVGFIPQAFLFSLFSSNKVDSIIVGAKTWEALLK